jgi:hypothetical protein
VGHTLYGYCTECGTRIPDGALKWILGSAYTAPAPDYKALLEEVANDAETEGLRRDGHHHENDPEESQEGFRV